MKRYDADFETKNSVMETYNGERHTISEWARILGINKNTLYKRYEYGDRGERLFREVRKKRPSKLNRGDW